MLLLHEHAKGNESRWWPFLRTLKMHVLSKKVVRELDGTYALELDRFHGESAEAALDFVNKVCCRWAWWVGGWVGGRVVRCLLCCGHCEFVCVC